MGLLKWAGILCIIAGVICLVVGIYGLAGGTGIEWAGVETPEEGGEWLSVLGIVILVVGAVLTYFGYKRS